MQFYQLSPSWSEGWNLSELQGSLITANMSILNTEFA